MSPSLTLRRPLSFPLCCKAFLQYFTNNLRYTFSIVVDILYYGVSPRSLVILYTELWIKNKSKNMNYTIKFLDRIVPIQKRRKTYLSYQERT